MNFGLQELLYSCCALVVLPVFFLAPGYIAASITGVMGFQRQSWIERLLWATALSQPISLLWAVHPGLPIPPRITTATFLLLSLAAVGCAWSDRKFSADTRWDRSATVVAIVAVALIPYVILSVLPIEIHGRIYESNIWQDWNVRIQLVNSAIRGGNAPGNPMFALAGQPAPLHYYYFWYVLCARMHDLVPVSSRAVFTASCVGSALSLLAFLLLAVKYLAPRSVPVRQRCVGALLVGSILGLDVVGYGLGWLHGRAYPDLQFWLDDRSPGWLHLILWSPHHVGGLVCCGLALLLTVCSLRSSRRQQMVHAALTGICLAASVGSSTFITLLFAFTFAGLVVDACRRREWHFVQTIALASVLSLGMAAPFLVHVLLAPVPPLTYAGAPQETTLRPHGMVHPGFRYRAQALRLLVVTLGQYDKSLKPAPMPGNPNFVRFRWFLRLYRWPLIAVMFVCDFGVFLFVLWYQFRTDFRRRAHALPHTARVLWLYFICIGVPGFFLDSGNGLTNNDVARDAGFCMRFVLLLWGAPMAAAFLNRWRASRAAGTPMRLTRTAHWAIAFGCLGILSQVSQLLLSRTRFILSDARLMPQVVVEERLARSAFRFDQIREAMGAADRATPVRGIVQGNPHSKLRNVLLLYTNRQMAAVDDGCNVPFGGSLADCVPMSMQLVTLFGGTGRHYQGEQKLFPREIPYEPQATTVANFQSLCDRYHLDTAVASFMDPAWWHRDSWIWQITPIYANSTARVFACPRRYDAPAASARLSQQPASPYTGF